MILTFLTGFYLPTLLTETVGFSQEMGRLIAAVSSTIYLVSAFGSLIIIDRLGRRKYLAMFPKLLGNG